MNFKIEIKSRILNEGFEDVRFLTEENSGKTIIVASFPYRLQEKNQKKGVNITPFARSDHYGEAVKRLKNVALFIREENSLKKKDIRIFCNSRLEEKLYAALSGLGFYGRNSLIITEKSGSRVILAGMIIPIRLEPDEALNNGTIPGALCGSCRACINNCPTLAIEAKGIINRDKCLQSLTTDHRILPEEIMEKWGNRLYGCSICQDCCPFNKFEQNTNDSVKGHIGDSVPFEFILNADDREMKEYFRGTALSMAWIDFDHLRRNTIISSVAENRVDLIETIEKFLNHEKIAYAAQWAVEKLKT